MNRPRVVEMNDPALWDPDLLEGKTSDELLAIKLDVDEALDRCKSQIQDAKATRAVEGEYADPEWWRRVNNAKASYGKQSQRIQMHLRILAERRKNANVDRDHLWHREFVHQAFLLLPQPDYERIHAEANKRVAR